MNHPFGHVVVIGASAGGVTALLEITRALPPAFAAPVCIVQHVGANKSLLPQLLRYRGPNPAVHAVDGQRLEPGTLYVAPPDQHMQLEGGCLKVRHGPKENHARPAIDPLFRTAAVSWGPRVIGVILTGQMDDGAAGMAAIQDCGGITIVQDPATAEEPGMPASALASVAPDYCVPLAEIAPLLQRLVGAPAPGSRVPPPERLLREAAINHGDASIENLLAVASPSLLTCPDCGGTLSEVKQGRTLRFRCHTGHAFSARSLGQLQVDAAEHALWQGVRALSEREMLLRRAAAVAQATGDQAQAAVGLAQADKLCEQIAALEAIARDTAPAGEARRAA